jgi:5-methylcytosine-specific restriction endonuclease McrA
MILHETALGCHVLVLNKHYMAMHIVNIKRAFSLLSRELAEVIDYDEGKYANYDFNSWLDISEFKKTFEPECHDWIDTVRISVAVPRIVRLLTYDRIPKKSVTLNRRNIFARDSNKCQYCGKYFSTSDLSLDHVVPRSRGGVGTWENLVCCCLKCNVKKGNKLLSETHMRLINKPIKPKQSPVVTFKFGDDRYESWHQFLENAYWSVELKK